MSVEFRAAGYIEVWRGAQFISRHRVEREAVESVLAHGQGEYELRFPIVRVIVPVPATAPTTPELGAPIVLSAVSLRVPLARPSTAPIALQEYALERRASGSETFVEIASGVDLFGAAGYVDAGLTTGTPYEYRALARDTTGRTSAWSAVVAATPAGDTTLRAPEGVQAVGAVGVIQVSWTPAATGRPAESFRVERTFAAGGEWSLKAEVTETAYNDTDVVAGQSKWYRITAVADAGAALSDPSAVVSATVPAAGPLIRFAPGHYMRPGLGDSLASILSKITGYDSRVRGLYAMRYWNLIETSKGVFDWSWHDSIMDACESAGKVVIFSVQDRRFNNAAPSASVPAYLQTEGLTFSHDRRATGSPISGCTLWRPQGMTYCIDVYKRIVDRYGHRSAFVGMRGEESIYGNPYGSTMGATYPDYNATAYMAQEVRRMQELRAYAPQLSWSLYTNFVQGDTASHGALQTWFAACRADLGVFLNGGPDVGPLRSEHTNTDGEEVMLGVVGGVNHLGQYLINQSSEQEEWEVSGMTVAQIYDVAVTQRGTNIMSWATNSIPVDPDTGQEYDHWDEEVYPYLAGHPVNTTVPAQLVGRVQVL